MGEQATTKQARQHQTLKLDHSVANWGEIVSKTLLETEHLPLSAREMFASVIPTSLMVHKDLRIHCQERVVQMICEIFQGIEASLQQLLHVREAELEILDARQVERQAASTKTEATLKAACENVCACEEEFRKDAGLLKKADEDLERAKVSLNGIIAKITEAEETSARITNVMTQSFTPLKDGSVETPADVEGLLEMVLSVAKDLEFEPSLLAVTPAALNQTPDKRSSFESLILQQFESGMFERSVKINEELESLASAKIEETGIVNKARTCISAAKDTYKMGFEALKQAQADKRVAQATHDDAVLAVTSCLLDHSFAKVARESAQSELIDFQTGPLTMFHELEKRVTQLPIKEDLANLISGIDAQPVAARLESSLIEDKEVEKTDSHLSGDYDTALCPKANVTDDVTGKVEAQKLEEPLRGDNFGVECGDITINLERMLPPSSEQSMGVVADTISTI